MGEVVRGEFLESRVVMLEMLISELLRLHGADSLHALTIRMDSRLERSKDNKALQDVWRPWSDYLLQRMGVMSGDHPLPDRTEILLDIREQPPHRR